MTAKRSRGSEIRHGELGGQAGRLKRHRPSASARAGQGRACPCQRGLQGRLKAIQHFFEHYKDLEAGKWVKVHGWEGPESAKQEIVDGIRRYEASL